LAFLHKQQIKEELNKQSPLCL